MSPTLSSRAQKYVWLCVPSVFSLVLTGIWCISIAPAAQRHTRQETQWRRDVATQKQRQDYLREQHLETDFTTTTLAGYVIGQSDPQTVGQTYFPSGYEKFAADQTIKLLDEYGGCVGFITAHQLYLEADNPGLCADSPAETRQQLEHATHP